MNLENIFYFTGIIFFLASLAGIIYMIILLTKMKNTVDMMSEKAKNTAQSIALTGYSLKAGILKTFLSFLGGKGGE